ncbi:CRISPR system precrRNA processing endoribonuclease RAMP protein Cas6 [Desulfobulbus elongatus]|uniref:CRISPR system precrRNA processing endoribonuclease RAMP protein Cas6 n=1 Tax=Desulfobulbus elongatus TaxID=53332 RepID=UPI00054FDA37|nr:CRISPR system precrRNA processing endoribonuclease RAMP protein Cas6 [Desulfobulbus elongatus]
MTIPLHHFTFHCRWTTEARLPEYLGSALRGAFGWALKKSSCALKNQDCGVCILRQRCAYAWIFETERYRDTAGRQVNARPHPYVLQPGNNTSGQRQPCGEWSFELLLIGRSIDFLPHIVYSVQQMGEVGIGAATRNGLGRFVLEKIDDGATFIFDDHSGRLHHPPTTVELGLAEPPEEPVHTLRCTLDTPLRLKQGDSLQKDLPFHVLIRAALRRIAALETAYGQGEPALDYSGLVRRAEQVETTASTIRWHETLRFSNRQQQKVSLSGLIGTTEYRGDLNEFVPLLEYAGRVNLGKQTVFGLGKMTMEWN